MLKKSAIAGTALALAFAGATSARAAESAPGSTASAQLSASLETADANGLVGCYVRGTTPFTVTHSSHDIHAEEKINRCIGSPDECWLGVDLEQYNPRTEQWHVVAHDGGGWGSCKVGRRLQATYKNCAYDGSRQWRYRSSIYLLVMKNGRTGKMGHGYSYENKFWCQ